MREGLRADTPELALRPRGANTAQPETILALVYARRLAEWRPDGLALLAKKYSRRRDWSPLSTARELPGCSCLPGDPPRNEHWSMSCCAKRGGSMGG